MRARLFSFLSCALLLCPDTVRGDDAPLGRLLVIGGNLRPDNAAVYRRFIEYAGGPELARFVVVPTASVSTEGPQRFAENLVRYGIDRKRTVVLDLTTENAAVQSSSPAIVEQIENCTGIFFTGGDQMRIMRALLRPDGTDTPALQAIRRVWSRGGVIAGTSAGAAVQCNPMIAVSGLADESLDEGMDALDFGLTKNPCCRGLLITRGLGVFRAGLVDQHFSQYRGRLARLSRACIEQHSRFGFGVDENTAMAVQPNGSIEVVGLGNLTIVDTRDATCLDGPLGCQLTGVRVTVLDHGDRFDPQTGRAEVRSEKKKIEAGTESYHGNHLITDIAGHGAAMYGLKQGLANNTSRKQVGVTLKYNRHYGHGYRLTFTKDDRSRFYAGYADGLYSYAMLDVRLDVEPVLSTLQHPRSVIPVDLVLDASQQAVQAAVFRGMLLLDEERRFRPDESITRAELAGAMAQTICLLPARQPPDIEDNPDSSIWSDEINRLVSAGLMNLDERGSFRPTAPIPRQEAAAMLVRLADIYRGQSLSSEPLPLGDANSVTPKYRAAAFAAVRAGLIEAVEGDFQPTQSMTRKQAAWAIYRIIGFPW